jgi:hypothetical protein
MVFDTLALLGVNLTEWGAVRGHPVEVDSWGRSLDRWRLMSGMPLVRELKFVGVSSMRIHQEGRLDLQLPSADRQVGLGGGEEGGGWVGVGTNGAGGAAAAVGADGRGGGDDGRLQSVSVVWAETRTAWGGGTEIVPRLAIEDALGVVEVRGALLDDGGPREGFVKEIRPYINGSMPFGDVDVAVVASQAPGSLYGALSGTFPAAGIRVGDILQGFGCAQQGLEGGEKVNCDPLPLSSAGSDELEGVDGSWGKVRGVLEGIGLGRESLVEQARLVSVFQGGANSPTNSGEDSGKVYHVVRGVLRSWPRFAVEFVSTFTPSANGLDRMHLVWKLSSAESSGVTVAGLVKSVSGIVAPPEMTEFYRLVRPSLEVSRFIYICICIVCVCVYVCMYVCINRNNSFSNFEDT